MSRGGGSRPGPPASCAACRTGTSTPLPCALVSTHTTLLPGMDTSHSWCNVLASACFQDLWPSLAPCPALRCPALPCPALPCPALPCPARSALLPCPATPLHATRPWPTPPGFTKLTFLTEILTRVLGDLTYIKMRQVCLKYNVDAMRYCLRHCSNMLMGDMPNIVLSAG